MSVDNRAAFALFALSLACGGSGTSANGLSGGGSTSGTGSSSGATTGGPLSGSSDAAGSGESGPAIKLDVMGDHPHGPGECGCGNHQWSYLWVANFLESTVSKINTRTLVEEGRYLTRADAAGNPSRTSVSIDGRAVAVANRYVGLVKIWAQEEFCEDRNANGTIETSSGPDDLLAFDSDECIAWFTDFEGMSTQRPVAWTPGTLNDDTCEYEGQKIWTTTGSGGMPGKCLGDGVWVHRVDGDTGAIEDSLHIPQTTVECEPNAAYGGAVDADGNFFFFVQQLIGNAPLVFRVDAQTLDIASYDYGNPDQPGYAGTGKYGFTVDTQGRVWTSGQGGLVRFDPTAQIAAGAGVPGPFGSGVAQDHQGRIWVGVQTEFEFGGGFGVAWADMDAATFGELVPLPSASVIKGVSVDVDGFIWAVPLSDGAAFKIDPVTFDVEIWQGGEFLYTYSDMTGGQLNNVTCNPAG